MKDILETLAYFDIFDHPLKSEEIQSFFPKSSKRDQIESELKKLIERNRIYKNGKYYSLQDNKSLTSKRKQLEQNAQDVLPMAKKYGNIIRSFPFVKAVMISGSLSKNVMEENDDVDFFIISKAKRIWLSKFFLKLYKFFYLKNSYKYFCINYFISEANLHIQEQNRYTATELLTLIPIGCEEEYQSLVNHNKWAKEILPNYQHVQNEYFNSKIKKPTWSRITESLFWGPFGNLSDHLCRYINKTRNALKYKRKHKENYELKLRSTAEQIKVHRNNQQLQTMDKFENKLKLLENEK